MLLRFPDVGARELGEGIGREARQRPLWKIFSIPKGLEDRKDYIG